MLPLCKINYMQANPDKFQFFFFFLVESMEPL